MSQLALARPLLQTKEKKKKRKTIFKTKRKRKRKEILNNDLAILPSHDICSVFDKENSIEFSLNSVHYLYMKSNPHPSFYPMLPYESLSSHTSINKKIKRKTIIRK